MEGCLSHFLQSSYWIDGTYKFVSQLGEVTAGLKV